MNPSSTGLSSAVVGGGLDATLCAPEALSDGFISVVLKWILHLPSPKITKMARNIVSSRIQSRC